MNTRALRLEILVQGRKLSDIAKAIGISKSSFGRKLKGETLFTQIEIVKIRDTLGITNEKVIEIFFNDKVS